MFDGNSNSQDFRAIHTLLVTVLFLDKNIDGNN